ncbi:MAG: hypothetical protein WBE45_21360 [Terriglobales bacterium]|jgi:hypothetical protein
MALLGTLFLPLHQGVEDFPGQPKHQSLSSSHEAGHAVIAEYLGYRVIHVSTAGAIVPADSPEAVLLSNGELAATGGYVEIDLPRLRPSDPDLDKDLQDIATFRMGGRAAEELTHPESALPNHWKADVGEFKEPLKKYKTEAELNGFLEEGYRRAKELLRDPEIMMQHQRLRQLLVSGVCSNRPNGEFVRKAIKGGK